MTGASKRRDNTYKRVNKKQAETSFSKKKVKHIKLKQSVDYSKTSNEPRLIFSFYGSRLIQYFLQEMTSRNYNLNTRKKKEELHGSITLE